jgi:hypothetical protein
MSTGLECDFFVYKGDWFYLLQDWDCPVGAWDWREYCTPYGPFGSEELTHQHLHDNHANPGGCSITDYGDGPIEPLLLQLIEKAKS